MKVGVLGAGVMGAGIAQVTATAGYETVCYDVDADALERGASTSPPGATASSAGVERGKLTRGDADAALRPPVVHQRRSTTPPNVDLVIEAVPEKLELKQQVFRDLDAAAPAGTILASNTSGFPIGQIAGGDQAARAGDRVALGVAAGGDAPGRDRARRRHQRRHRADGRRASPTACGKNPVVINDSPERHVGLRRQPRVHAR